MLSPRNNCMDANYGKMRSLPCLLWFRICLCLIDWLHRFLMCCSIFIRVTFTKKIPLSEQIHIYFLNKNLHENIKKFFPFLARCFWMEVIFSGFKILWIIIIKKIPLKSMITNSFLKQFSITNYAFGLYLWHVPTMDFLS